MFLSSIFSTNAAAACPTQSHQSGSAGLEGMDDFLETRTPSPLCVFLFFLPRVFLFLGAKVRGTAAPLHYHEALSVPYTSSPGDCSGESEAEKSLQLDSVHKIRLRSDQLNPPRL